MRTLQSILLATDLRPASQEAAKVAVQLASAFGSRMTLLHVLEPIPTWTVSEHLLRKQAEEPLQETTELLTAQKVVVAESSIVLGHPADTIVSKAQEIDADLILIGAGERSPFDRFSVGPVAEAVLEHAPQPVLAVRPGEPVPNFRRILCPVDQSDASRRGLRNAIRLAHVFGRQVVVLTVVPEVSWLTAVAETGQFADAMAQYAHGWCGEFENFLGSVPFDDVEVKKDIRHGTPHQQIIEAAQEHQADVIIMGATGRSNLARFLLGSVTRSVLKQLPCSLLTVKEEDVVEELLEGDICTINRLMAEGRELLASGAYPAAMAKFRRVVTRNRFHVAAAEGLAEACEGLGEREKAEFYRHRARKLRNEG